MGIYTLLHDFFKLFTLTLELVEGTFKEIIDKFKKILFLDTKYTKEKSSFEENSNLLLLLTSN